MKPLLSSSSVVVCLSILLLAACVPAPTAPPVAVLPTATPIVAASATPTLTPTPMPIDTPTAMPTTHAPTATPTPVPPMPTLAPTNTPTPTATPSQPRVEVAKASNIREGPGTNYPVVGKGSPGDQLEVCGRNEGGDWVQICGYTDPQRWIYAGLGLGLVVFKDGGGIDQLPAVPAPPTPTPVSAFTLSGLVFFDYNGNGVRDDNEPGIPGATVRIGNLAATTASDGSYTLQGVPKGKQAIRLSAEGFRYISLSLEAFQSSEQPVSLMIDDHTRRDWGLMQGFLTLPFKCETVISFIIHVDVDPDPAFRDWRGSDGSDYVKERDVLNGHLGTDFAVLVDQLVIAAAPGVVTEAEGGWPDNPKALDPDTGLHEDGNRVVINHGGGLLTIYCHLNSVSVVAGQRVARGGMIGLSGRTGIFAPGQPAHLHFQFGGFGQRRIDPYRNLLDLNSKSWWTKASDPQCFP